MEYNTKLAERRCTELQYTVRDTQGVQPMRATKLSYLEKKKLVTELELALKLLLRDTDISVVFEIYDELDDQGDADESLLQEASS